ncbi:unnamed protein product, partial [Polarella glacialis]
LRSGAGPFQCHRHPLRTTTRIIPSWIRSMPTSRRRTCPSQSPWRRPSTVCCPFGGTALLQSCVLISAHGNSLRALVKYLDNVPEDKIVGLNIPTGVPLVYKLNHRLQPVALPDHAEGLSAQYLGDADWVDAKISGVKNHLRL